MKKSKRKCRPKKKVVQNMVRRSDHDHQTPDPSCSHTPNNRIDTPNQSAVSKQKHTNDPQSHSPHKPSTNKCKNPDPPCLELSPPNQDENSSYKHKVSALSSSLESSKVINPSPHVELFLVENNDHANEKNSNEIIMENLAIPLSEDHLDAEMEMVSTSFVTTGGLRMKPKFQLIILEEEPDFRRNCHQLEPIQECTEPDSNASQIIAQDPQDSQRSAKVTVHAVCPFNIRDLHLRKRHTPMNEEIVPMDIIQHDFRECNRYKPEVTSSSNTKNNHRNLDVIIQEHLKSEQYCNAKRYKPTALSNHQACAIDQAMLRNDMEQLCYVTLDTNSNPNPDVKPESNYRSAQHSPPAIYLTATQNEDIGQQNSSVPNNLKLNDIMLTPHVDRPLPITQDSTHNELLHNTEVTEYSQIINIHQVTVHMHQPTNLSHNRKNTSPKNKDQIIIKDPTGPTTKAHTSSKAITIVSEGEHEISVQPRNNMPEIVILPTTEEYKLPVLTDHNVIAPLSPVAGPYHAQNSNVEQQPTQLLFNHSQHSKAPETQVSICNPSHRKRRQKPAADERINFPKNQSTEQQIPFKKRKVMLRRQSCKKLQDMITENFHALDISEFEVVRNIGHGAFGDVFKARNTIVPPGGINSMVALKKFQMKRSAKSALMELTIIKDLFNSNVIHLLHVVINREEAINPQECTGVLYLAMELMHCNLSELIRSEFGRLTLDQIASCSKQLLQGINYLHQKGIMHRDIKGANILLNIRGEVKVADLGLACHWNQNMGPFSSCIGTLWFRPPELLLGSVHYGPSIDVWSAGCVIVELFSRKITFRAKTELAMLSAICDKCGTPNEFVWPGIVDLPKRQRIEFLPAFRRRLRTVYSYLPVEALNLIDGMLELDPLLRCTTVNALNSQWLRDVIPSTVQPPQLPTN